MNPLSAEGISYNLRKWWSGFRLSDKAVPRGAYVGNKLFPVKNFSGLVSDDEVRRWCAVVTIQLLRDLAPAYGLASNYEVRLVNPDYDAPSTELHDNGGGLLTDEMFGGHVGTGLNVVNVKKCLNAHPGHASMTFSHELLEMAHNPDALSGGKEIGDKYQDVSFGYFINGIYVSNFEMPDGKAFR